MNNDFPRIITLLRKEKGITQKQAADDLEIAQALLSHYEKGKRECGLDFLVKAADYYNVSTDYLLGRSPVSSGKQLTESDIPDTSAEDMAKDKTGDFTITLNKKLITNSIEIIYSLLDKIKCNSLTKSISNMLMLSIYRAFRITYKANGKNNSSIFKIDDTKAPYLISSAIDVENGKAVKSAIDECENSPLITTAILEENYKGKATALLNLVKNVETRIDKMDS